MTHLTCDWCKKTREISADILEWNVGPNLWECDCGKQNIAYGEASFDVVDGGKYEPHKPVFCPHCNFDLNAWVEIDTVSMHSVCPNCREPYSVRIERQTDDEESTDEQPVKIPVEDFDAEAMIAIGKAVRDGRTVEMNGRVVEIPPFRRHGDNGDVCEGRR